MMTVASGMPPGDDAAAEARPSLRERKKQATRLSLRRVALDLVAEHGFGRVTVEDIADAADVSPRTFFNYFPSKEAVIFGADTGRTEALRLRLLHRATPRESALTALREALVAEARARADDLDDLGGDQAEWLRRMKAAHIDPHFRAAASAHMANVERAIAEALAERLGTDLEQDPYPVLLAATGTGVLRSAMTFWARTGGTVPIDQLTDVAFAALAGGLAEDCALRRLTAARDVTGTRTALLSEPTGKDNDG